MFQISDMETLLNSYDLKKGEIKKRLEDFRKVWQQTDRRIFAELCYCVCTPQSKAEVCDRVISKLERNNLLFVGNEKQIRPFLNLVRFPRNKTKYIVEARNFFTENGELKIKEKIESFDSIHELREWLVENVKGFGYKEASHFLRNIGFGENLAILDRHVLKNLKKYGAVEEIPKTLTRKKYFEIEQNMKEFSKKINIPLAEMDLLFWSEETGKILK